MKDKYRSIIYVLLVGFLVIGCSSDSSKLDEYNNVENTSSSVNKSINAKILNKSEYTLSPISDAEFNALSYENKLLVAYKIYTALLSGVAKYELDKKIESNTFISDLHATLMSPNSDLYSIEEIIDNKDYSSLPRNYTRERIFARLFNMKLGYHYVNRLSAYLLTQNIMFSPAYELNSVDGADISNVYNKLVRQMDKNISIENITYDHMMSDDNWKRFRSPEDNSREMLELFLYDKNDSKVPLAAKTLQNWKLETRSKELMVGLNVNNEPIEMFDTIITTGDDFYKELVLYKDFKPSVIRRLVEVYFTDFSSQRVDELVAQIKRSNPERFQDILLQIIFSKAFIFEVQRVKTFEEAVFSMGKKISFYAGRNFFGYMRDAIDKSNQGSMKYKLGRSKNVPIDSLSFSNYYKFMRERILNDLRYNQMHDWDNGWEAEFINNESTNFDTLDEFIDYLFIASVQRHPTADELDALHDFCVNEKNYGNIATTNNKEAVAIIVLEYISRLTEVYTYKLPSQESEDE